MAILSHLFFGVVKFVGALQAKSTSSAFLIYIKGITIDCICVPVRYEVVLLIVPKSQYCYLFSCTTKTVYGQEHLAKSIGLQFNSTNILKPVQLDTHIFHTFLPTSDLKLPVSYNRSHRLNKGWYKSLVNISLYRQ